MGGVFRNDRGDWLLGFQHSKPSSSPLQSELEALKLGLSIALNYDFSPLIVETDAAELIKVFYSDAMSYTSIITDCRWLMHQLKHPKITHNFWEGNKVARKMAKDGLKHARKNQVFVNPLPLVLNNLAMDRNGYVYLTKKLSINACFILVEMGNVNVLEACPFTRDVPVSTM
ncbi:uncharacterized protein [Nicotiana sylvestris]|uniref:uncharacterized protein n=1 Tax=Nicotiana sylvestris TaxID=4096 RepID=UPI00388C9902